VNEKVLVTSKVQAREKISPEPGKHTFLSLHELEKGQIHLNDLAYITKFSEPKEWLRWRKEVEAQRSKIPAYSYWICPSCGWRGQFGGDKREGGVCLVCNLGAFKQGGFLRPMNEAEREQFEKDEAERIRRQTEQVRLMEFGRQNVNRAKEGLPPLTRAEFDEQERRRSRDKAEDMAQLMKGKT
jgi:hypothetical protein